MASILIDNLPSLGSDLLMDSESFLADITDNEFSGIMGGRFLETVIIRTPMTPITPWA